MRCTWIVTIVTSSFEFKWQNEAFHQIQLTWKFHVSADFILKYLFVLQNKNRLKFWYARYILYHSNFHFRLSRKLSRRKKKKRAWSREREILSLNKFRPALFVIHLINHVLTFSRWSSISRVSFSILTMTPTVCGSIWTRSWNLNLPIESMPVIVSAHRRTSLGRTFICNLQIRLTTKCYYYKISPKWVIGSHSFLALFPMWRGLRCLLICL